MPQGREWLGPAEREHLTALRVAKRRHDWLLGRWTAKQTLLLDPNTCLDIRDLARLEILATAEGGPCVHFDGEILPHGISLSHRRGMALCAISGQASVGCDLEWIEPRSAAFVDDYFTSTEQTLIEESGVEGPTLVANGLWSAKESVLKLLGVGLRADPRSLTVLTSQPPTTAGWRQFEVRRASDGRMFEGWWRRERSWILTVVTEPPSPRPRDLDHREWKG